MSNIIKGGRTRNQGIINLYSKTDTETDVLREQMLSSTAIISVVEEKKKEYHQLEIEMQVKAEEAQLKIEQMLEEARLKAKEIEEEARNREEFLYQQLSMKQEEMIKKSQEEAKKIRELALEEKEKLLGDIEGDTVETIISMVQHIISEEVTYNNQWLSYIVHHMLRKEQIKEKVVLAVSKKQYKNLIEGQEESVQTLLTLCELKEDLLLEDTACKLITPQGSIYYDIANGLERVISELRILHKISKESAEWI